ncbi:alpha/beta hydrolase [Streptosporangiaceae bacterium NEAU-GS5]|nr:alpha/beta hydrolase [Streptosporangiaceae bacterium NEAU-GS5]
MNTVLSADGTRIAYDTFGSEGATVILVSGATGRRSDPFNTNLAELLASRFTVYNYDRRGRGDSGDTAPYAVDREIEDIAALIDAAGGSAFVFGISSGGVLALRAARRLPQITKVAAYEPPFVVDDSRPPLPADYVERLDAAIAAGRRGDAGEIFMIEAAGVPAEYLPGMHDLPFWPFLEEIAHTIAYDGRIMADTMSGKPLKAEWTELTTRALVVDGGELPVMHSGAKNLAELAANIRHVTLGGQTHDVDPKVLAPVLIDFFS